MHFICAFHFSAYVSNIIIIWMCHVEFCHYDDVDDDASSSICRVSQSCPSTQVSDTCWILVYVLYCCIHVTYTIYGSCSTRAFHMVNFFIMPCVKMPLMLLNLLKIKTSNSMDRANIIQTYWLIVMSMNLVSSSFLVRLLNICSVC